MDGPPTKTPVTATQECASLPRDPARHPSPRFSRDTKGTHQTAEHHSLSRPRTLSGEVDTLIPEAFPDDWRRSRSLGHAPIRVKSDPNLGSPSDPSSAFIEDELPNLAATIALPIPDEDEDLSFEAKHPIPPPIRPATGQPHLQPELKQGDTAVRVPHPTKERDIAFSQGSTTHGGSSIIQGLEEAAIEVYHEAEHMLHDVGETVSAYFGGRKTSGEEARDRDSQNKPSAASGADTPRARTTEGGSVQIPADQVIAESMRGRNISGNPTALPHTIQREYFRSKEYDLDGDRMDVSEFLFEDDASNQGMDLNLGEGSEAAPRTLEREEIGVGYGGVEYHLKGHGGILPGYPTPEGMRKLLSERMKDDLLRAAGAENPSTKPPLSTSSDGGEHENVVRGRSQIIKGEPSISVQTVLGPYGELVTEGSPAEISPDSRIVGEKKALPVFVSGEPTAAGKYEAIFEPVADEPKEFQAQQVGEAPAFKCGSSLATDTLEGRLGGPITNEQDILEAEKARHATSKN